MSSPFGSATLVLHGPSGKVKFEITGERTTVGRTRDNELVLQDPAVSSHHCEFVAEKVGLVLRDLGSSNGTYVNGRRLQAGPVYEGDLLKIGQHQGRISVLRVDGKPLKPPGAGMAVVVAAVLGVLVLGGGLAGWYFLVKQPAARDEVLFGEYEGKAKEFLTVEPCSAVEDAVRKLRAIDTRLEPPSIGRRGRLARAEMDKNTAILATLRTKQPLLEEAAGRVETLLSRQRTQVDALRAYQKKFHSDELVRTSRALEAIFAERAQAGEEFLDRWKKFSDQVVEYNKLLARVNTGSDRDAADQLDGFRFKIEPAKLLAECQSRYGKTQQDGLLKLASVEL